MTAPRGILTGSLRWHLAGGLALAVALGFLPHRAGEGLRGLALDLLRPGQQAAEVGLDWGRSGAALVRQRGDIAAKLAALEAEVARLSGENDQLREECRALQLAAETARQPASEGTEEPLLAARLISARLVGRQAQAFLAAHDLLDVGTAAGVQPRAWVVDDPAGLAVPIVDQGTEAHLAPGHYVLTGRRVLGRIAVAGRQTSSLARVTDAGYRDLVVIAHRDGEEVHPGPQGILEGTGEPECRIRLVDVTSPVAVGDLVYTADTEGLLPAPLFYGEVTSVEAPTSARHWEIRVRPAAGVGRVPRVAILRTEVNPARLAEQPALETRE